MDNDPDKAPDKGGRYLRDPDTGALIPIDEDGNPLSPQE